jgi:DNA-binding response OmpR family regulator
MVHGCQQVLAIDPDLWLHTDLTKELRGKGIAVLVASNSYVALQAVADGFKPDAVLVDFAAEDAGVAQLLRHVKSAHATLIIALVPEASLVRIGPFPDRVLHRPFQVKNVIAALDALCSPRSGFDGPAQNSTPSRTSCL